MSNVRWLLALLLAFVATEASAQFNLGPNKSRVVPLATQNALHQSMVHVRLDLACRDHLAPVQRAELRHAAGQAFLAVGYQPAGADAVVRELHAMMMTQRSWTPTKCTSEYDNFREGRQGG